MITHALSSGVFADQLMRGPTTTAVCLGHGHLRVGRYVVSLTPPGSPRMPNGIECSLVLYRGEEAAIGDRALRASNARVLTGPIWDARPTIGVLLEASPLQHFDVDALIGAGPGLTPEGDDVLIGFVAGRVLFHDDVMTARRILLASAGPAGGGGAHSTAGLGGSDLAARRPLEAQQRPQEVSRVRRATSIG